MKGFILAGGAGARLYPLTLEIPKPLVTVGKIPILTYLVELYLKYGVDDIKINIQEENLQDFYKWKGLYFPREKIDFLVEKKPSGTLTPLLKTKNWFSEPIVVSNGDELKELNLKKMVDFHFRKKGLTTVGLVKVEDPRVYGVAKLNEDKIIEFIEKPKNPPSPYINSGIYVLNPKIKDYFPLNTKFAMLEIDLFPRLAKEGKLFGYKWQGKWSDCGNFNRWEKAILDWQKNEVPKATYVNPSQKISHEKTGEKRILKYKNPLSASQTKENLQLIARLTDYRPWGKIIKFVDNTPCTVKILCVNKGECLSLQTHQLRDESWYMISGKIEVTLGKNLKSLGKTILKEGQSIMIPREFLHQADGLENSKILETSTGKFGEDDEIRFDDRYERGVPRAEA